MCHLHTGGKRLPSQHLAETNKRKYFSIVLEVSSSLECTCFRQHLSLNLFVVQWYHYMWGWDHFDKNNPKLRFQPASVFVFVHLFPSICEASGLLTISPTFLLVFFIWLQPLCIHFRIKNVKTWKKPHLKRSYFTNDTHIIVSVILLSSPADCCEKKENGFVLFIVK